MKCPLYIPFIKCINKQSNLANKRPDVQHCCKETTLQYLFFFLSLSVHVVIVVHVAWSMLLLLLLFPLLLLLDWSAAAFISFALSQSTATVGEPGKPRTN